MGYTTEEGLRNGSLLLSLLADAVMVDSDGGTEITASEWLAIAPKIGIEIVKDIQD